MGRRFLPPATLAPGERIRCLDARIDAEIESHAEALSRCGIRHFSAPSPRERRQTEPGLAERLGADAFHLGIRYQDCPFPSSEASTFWHLGWIKAEGGRRRDLEPDKWPDLC